MTRQELQRIERAHALADELVRRSRGENQTVAVELRALLEPPPSLRNIIMQVPGATHRERIQAMGISHQGFYNLLAGRARPNSRTRHVLAKLTGLSEDAIMEAM